MYIAHRHAKHYTISSNGTGGVLMIMPLEQLSTVTQLDNAFDITSTGRHFVLTYTGKLQCFTTNSIECNSHRLRRRLSNDCSAGNCLVLNFAKCNTLEIEITNCNKLPIGKAVVKESLLSTYLNYMNNKNIYLTVNKLRAVNALTLSAMVYTNSNYVWQYLQQMEAQDACYSGSSYYYDTNRHMVSCQDDMTYALALLYYATVTGNVSVLTPERIGTIQNILYSYHGDGVQLCVVALALKKLSRLNIDKVRALVEYTAVKKLIMSNKNLYAYAQAIGALPMVNASKQRLKSLVNIHNIPRCFYYVSQLENIYGIELIGNKLRVRPSTDDTTSLEQLLLRVGDKSISTIFDKGDNYSLLLNGLQCYSGVDVAQLPADNTLLVSC